MMETIRQLKQDDDLSDLIELSRQFFSEYQGHHEVFFGIEGLTDAHIADYFARTTGSDDSATFVAAVEHRVVGSITVHIRQQAPFYKVGRIGAISGLMVSAEWRRRGIATRLLAKARDWFREKQVQYFTVYTATANAGAIQFYGQSGMQPLHTTFIGEIAPEPA
jgi:GNAT superfamily N-acetyltransferase